MIYVIDNLIDLFAIFSFRPTPPENIGKKGISGRDRLNRTTKQSLIASSYFFTQIFIL